EYYCCSYTTSSTYVF
nr:immunoglobulin light chain junction region [Macaca mulatta]